MGTEKKFYRARLKGTCAVNTKMVNGVTLTKEWQVKVGCIGDFAKFSDVEAQVVVKQGNGFVPVEEGSGGAEDEADGSPASTDATAQPGGGQAVPSSDPAGSAEIPDFNNWTVEQLKTWLITKGVVQNELRNATKPELIERADFIWSQN